jgi:zinc D-Ala-D-Ala carboxypeptidase
MAVRPLRRAPRPRGPVRFVAVCGVVAVPVALVAAILVTRSPSSPPVEPDVAVLGPAPAVAKSAPPAPDPLHGAGPTDAERMQVDDPASDLAVVNKQRPIQPLDYAPATVPVGGGFRLRPDAAQALAALEAAAAADGVPMHPSSGYRSYVEQVSTYARWKGQMGSSRADALSARPGFSEHQTGLAADMRPDTGTCRAYSTCFGSTPQAAWLAQHAVEYGFVVRYEAGQTAVTGYDPEPWHIRYVGVDVARRYAESGAHSLEEYFGLPAAPTY